VISSDESGFTLIEVMIVIVIVAILSAVAYPSYEESVRKSKRAEGRAALMQLMQQEERFYSQNTKYIVFSVESTEDHQKKFKWFSADTAAASSYEIKATACSGDVIQNCVLLTARPGTGRVNSAFKDSACEDLMLTSTGEKTASGTATNCWQ
jgi:type IV pilus assembly protein PilE